jgi:sugar-specific transcriptional regulator TrmB
MTKIVDEKEKTELLRNLESFGVLGHSGEVYLALLGEKEAGITRLEQKTGLHRQLIYNALHDLEEKGLAKHTIFNGRKRFSSQPAKRLQTLVDEKQKLASDLIGKLSSLALPGQKQEFEVFQGEAAFVAHEMQSLLEAEEGETLCVLASNWERFYAIMSHKIEAYEKLRVARKIKLRIIGLESQKYLIQNAKKKRPLFEARVVPGLKNGLMDTSIWKRSISFNFFGEPPIIFDLKNEEIARSQQTFFDSLWEMGKE